MAEYSGRLGLGKVRNNRETEKEKLVSRVGSRVIVFENFGAAFYNSALRKMPVKYTLSFFVISLCGPPLLCCK